jgi:transcriptional regulator with XRE-family HTH domain
MNITPKKAGQRLNQFIESLDISKAEFSRETGLNYAHMHRIINGDGDPGFDTCSKISEAYPQLSMTWLIAGAGEMINITREERNDIKRVRAWREENATDTSAVLSLFKAETSDHKFLSSELRKKRVYDEQIIKRLKGILLELFIERRELWSDLYNKFKNDYSAEKDTEKLTEEEVLDQMHGSPELKGLDEYIVSFCALRNKSQSKEIINEHLKTRK